MTNPAESGTNPGADVTAGSAASRWAVSIAAVWIFVNAAVNSASTANDLVRRGVPFAPSEPWVWEFSSAFSLLVWLLPVLWFDGALRARVSNPWARFAAYAAASVVFSVAHVATMVGLRHIAYRVAGSHYDFGPWGDGLLYEYRKDALTFVAIVAVAAALRAVAARVKPLAQHGALPVASTEATAKATATATATPLAAPAPTFIVRTATQGDLLVRADEVDWVEAQGNYVALHVGVDARMLRCTLAHMEARLKAHGFIRTHRRALVNRQRMQAIIAAESGEPGVRLSSGQVAPLSESRRAEVLRLVLGT